MSNKIVWLAINAQYVHTSLSVRYLREVSRKYAETEILELTINNHLPEMLGRIYETQPDVLGISCYIWNVEQIKKLLPLLEKVLPGTVIICGGPEVSYNTEAFMREYPAVDYVIQGEGEISLQGVLEHIINHKEALPEKGVSWRSVDGELHISCAVDVPDVNEIPFPYREEEMEEIKDKILYYETSRGCPFSCAYCLSCATVGVRFLQIERVLREIDFFARHNVKQIKFVDRTFNANKKHFLPILRFIKELPDTCRTNFHFEVASDYFDEETLEILSEFPKGRVQLEVGIQSTNEQTLKAVARTNHWDKITQNIRRIIEGKNIHVHTDLIIGLPYEPMESFHRSFNEVYKLHSHQLQLGFLKFLSGAYMMRLVEEGEYLYQNQAPYEVLSNKWMTYGEIHWLHIFEDVFEMYHNAGRAGRTIDYLVEAMEAGDGFRFYQKFTDWWKKKEYHHRPHSDVHLYEALYMFALEEYKELSTETIDGLLRLELLEQGSSHIWPSFLKWSQESMKTRIAEFWRTGRAAEYIADYRFTNWHDIRHKYHVEFFEKDPFHPNDTAKEGVCILFDYSKDSLEWHEIIL